VPITVHTYRQTDYSTSLPLAGEVMKHALDCARSLLRFCRTAQLATRCKFHCARNNSGNHGNIPLIALHQSAFCSNYFGFPQKSPNRVLPLTSQESPRPHWWSQALFRYPYSAKFYLLLNIFKKFWKSVEIVDRRTFLAVNAHTFHLLLGEDRTFHCIDRKSIQSISCDSLSFVLKRLHPSLALCRRAGNE